MFTVFIVKNNKGVIAHVCLNQEEARAILRMTAKSQERGGAEVSWMDDDSFESKNGDTCILWNVISRSVLNDNETLMYGNIFTIIPTEAAQYAITHNAHPCDKEDGDEEWWRVAALENGDELWMTNMAGILLVLTEDDKSYYRYF